MVLGISQILRRIFFGDDRDTLGRARAQKNKREFHVAARKLTQAHAGSKRENKQDDESDSSFLIRHSDFFTLPSFALARPSHSRILAAMADQKISEVLAKPDAALEMTLRPSLFSEFTGQLKVKERLEITVAAAKQRKEAIDHLLLNGPPGLGKTTLANIIAKAMGANLKSTSGPTIEKAGDLAGLLTNLEEGDVLFIDEIHRLQKTIEEYLYPAMEDFKLDIIIDQGPNARSVRLNLPRFTLIGATTRSGLLTAPLLTRFPIRERLDYYHAEQLHQIVVRSARLLNVEMEEKGDRKSVV